MKQLVVGSCVLFSCLFACSQQDEFDRGSNVKNATSLELVGQMSAKHMPPSFVSSFGRAVPMDILSSDVTIKFDPQSCGMSGVASIDFVALGDGMPYFDLVPSPIQVTLDGKKVELPEISDPDSVTKLRLVKQNMSASETHKLEVTYNITHVKAACSNKNSARHFFDMTDFHGKGRGFWENYGPANLEFDQFPLRLRVEVVNTNVEHFLEVNGNLNQLAFNSWETQFPEQYNAASFFIHVFPKNHFQRVDSSYKGIQKEIPIVLYGTNKNTLNKALKETLAAFPKFENAYGPYAHPRFVAYVTGEMGGGMEFAGATITSVWALSHELAHSWFARGVMPASGNAGWMDEALASWSANDFPRASKLPNRQPVKLDGYSPYKRSSVNAAYSEGMNFISELDLLFAEMGGMKSLLKRFHNDATLTVVQTADFKNFLEKHTGQNLDEYFGRYVYGKNQLGIVPVKDFHEGYENPYHTMLPSQLE